MSGVWSADITSVFSSSQLGGRCVTSLPVCAVRRCHTVAKCVDAGVWEKLYILGQRTCAGARREVSQIHAENTFFAFVAREQLQTLC